MNNKNCVCVREHPETPSGRISLHRETLLKHTTLFIPNLGPLSSLIPKLGRLPGIEPGSTVPQTVVLPLHHNRHKPSPLLLIVMDKVVAIMTKPR